MVAKHFRQSGLSAAIAAALAALPAGIGIAALAVVIDQGGTYPAGCNAQIFPDGKFRAEDGRPSSLTEGECKDWLMNQEVADRLIAQCKQAPILYDYDHNSIYGDTEASGWIVDLVYVPGQGLFGKVEWTPEGQEKVVGKAYRYSSPYFYFEVATGKVTELISVALTNNPALGDLGGVGLSKGFSAAGGALPGNPPEDQSMELKEQVAALTGERDTLKADLAKTTGELNELETKFAALQKEKADADLKAETEKRDALVDAALNDGRLVPALKEWAQGQSLADLAKYLDAAKPLPLANGPQADLSGKGAGHGLTHEQLAMCEKMGVTPEQFKAAQA